MQSFFMPNMGVCHIDQYQPEYAGLIQCEDENCRVPIRIITPTINKDYLKVAYPHKHSPLCKVCSNHALVKNKRNFKRNKERVKLPPIFPTCLKPSSDHNHKSDRKDKNRKSYSYTGGNMDTYHRETLQDVGAHFN
ncbi:MAG TPA: hypothetical protein VIM51_07650 [Desulfosporosinus sp.]